MWAHFLHEVLVWFNTEYWGTSWPNIFAPSIYTILGFVLADIRNERRAKATRQHHANIASELSGQIEMLSGRVKSLLGGKNGITHSE